ncbi:threonine/serine ThrE exporter family protein [Mycobacterium sp. MS1601]|uniref:threonine/serine ThrE exporter family protein n=1 Tax=Mycobacterium sp. MS1601 TaxID=1936029 RepID=UPI001F3B5C0D|nr:threonine/serine exporter family protein [Mycobacterium sp. MS1601]
MVESTRERTGQAWLTRQRGMLTRMVRETDPPTDTLPRISAAAQPDHADYQLVDEVLDLAGNIGAILMASGMSATSTMDQVTAVASAYGVKRCEVDVINTTIHIAAYRGPSAPAASTLHIVQSRSIDFSRLAAVERLVDRIRAGQISPTDARQELGAIITAPHPYKRWIATLAWGALAYATAGTLGGTWLVCLVSALSAMTIDRVNRRLNRHGLPFFFQYVVGGAIATAPPILLYWLGPTLGLQFRPTVAVAAGLVVLLAGLSLVGSVGDVISGAPVTAAGRFFELVMMTGATIAGVAVVLHFANQFGAPFVAINGYAPPALAELPARVAFGAASAAAYALACYAERSAAMAAGFGGAAGTIVFLAANGAGVGAVVASFAAAVAIGLVGRLMERRNLAPPLVVSIAGIVPLLPGLALLHGVYAILNDQHAVGFASVLSAFLVGTALAAGVTLGEWSSWKVRRRRLQARRGNRRLRLSGQASLSSAD